LMAVNSALSTSLRTAITFGSPFTMRLSSIENKSLKHNLRDPAHHELNCKPRAFE
jgi:hypothetical protein